VSASPTIHQVIDVINRCHTIDITAHQTAYKHRMVIYSSILEVAFSGYEIPNFAECTSRSQSEGL
jgi:hypothetical protein